MRDFAEEIPSKREQQRSRMRCCAKCKRVLHPKNFRRPLTRAQAAARGYTLEKLVYVESTLCKACQPGRKPTLMSERELREAAYNGRISESRVEVELAARKQRLRKKIQTAQYRRWRTVKAQPWLDAKKIIYAEQRRMESRLRYVMKGTMSPLSEAADSGFMEQTYLMAYIEALKQTAARAFMHAKMQTSPKTYNPLIKSLFPAPTRQRLAALLQAAQLRKPPKHTPLFL